MRRMTRNNFNVSNSKISYEERELIFSCSKYSEFSLDMLVEEAVSNNIRYES